MQIVVGPTNVDLPDKMQAVIVSSEQDVELQITGQMIHLLETIDPVARGRIMRYLTERFEGSQYHPKNSEASYADIVIPASIPHDTPNSL